MSVTLTGQEEHRDDDDDDDHRGSNSDRELVSLSRFNQ